MALDDHDDDDDHYHRYHLLVLVVHLSTESWMGVQQESEGFGPGPDGGLADDHHHHHGAAVAVALDPASTMIVDDARRHADPDSNWAGRGAARPEVAPPSDGGHGHARPDSSNDDVASYFGHVGRRTMDDRRGRKTAMPTWTSPTRKPMVMMADGASCSFPEPGGRQRHHHPLVAVAVVVVDDDDAGSGPARPIERWRWSRWTTTRPRGVMRLHRSCDDHRDHLARLPSAPRVRRRCLS